MTQAARGFGEWRTRSRLARLHDSHSYGRVLVLVGVCFVFAASPAGGAWSGSALLLAITATLVTALWTSGVARADSRLSVWLVLVSTTVAVVNLVWGGVALESATAVFTAVSAAAAIGAIAVGVADAAEVSARSVLGAISIYVLLGLLFVFVYGAVATIGSEPFFAQGTDGTRALRLYFSYVTLGTLGYGDYTAAGDLGHTLAVVEALLGQLYLVTVVALLVSRLHRR